MKKINLLLSLLFFSISFFSQSDIGMFSIGMRNTISVFDHDKNAKIGYGAGGQFRVQLTERLNTEWFLDRLQQDLGETAFRKDLHIGWSLMYYPWLKKEESKRQIVKPYLIAGHCFDWSELILKDERNITGKKFGSAVQFGLGTHLYLTKRLDVTFVSQYMIHLGKDVELVYDEHSHSHEIENHNYVNAYGHLLLTLGINYKIVNLWKAKN